MKKLLYLLICLPLIFNSCKKDDDSPNNGDGNTSGSILGSWELTEIRTIETEGYYTSNGNKVITNTEDEIITPGSASLLSETLTFSSNGVLTIDIYLNGETETREMSYQKNGNTLTLNEGVDEFVYSITTLSFSKLTLYYSSGEQTWEEDGIVYFEESNATIKFDKLAFAPDNSNSKKIKSNKDSFFKTSIDRRKKR